ncbi:spherulation-specific family 4 protein [Streptomyces sp. NPDC048845]|uniref:spherulation-specific family 4 protein n=1 Tax=Streptomyces sp. NPDC048845 TaxID=3155390 RepID=UPI003441F84F
MPPLTPAGTRQPVAARPAGLGVGVPGCAHPLLAPLEWAGLGRPGVPLHWAVLDVAHGPGVRPDPHCLEAAGRLRNGGVRVLGHLDMCFGARHPADIAADARRYVEWYLVDGFLLHRCPSGRAGLDRTRRTVAGLRALRDGGHVVLGHGRHPDPGYAETADQLVTFAGPWSEYRWSQAPEWTAEHPAERFCHLVHGVPRGHLEEALRTARWQGAATVWFTDRTGPDDPWATLPGYWDEIVSRIGTSVSE